MPRNLALGSHRAVILSPAIIALGVLLVSLTPGAAAAQQAEPTAPVGGQMRRSGRRRTE